MIKFFRKIRQQRLTENKYSKYLIYAIGEIVLVVIGILIALQINNWNEQQKLAQTEIKLLKELKSDLKTSQNNLAVALNTTNDYLDNDLEIWNYVKDDLPYDSKLDENFKTLRNADAPEVLTSTYETLKSLGLKIISNDNLRRSIVNFYNTQLPNTVGDYNDAENFKSLTSMELFYVENIQSDIYDGSKAYPNNFESLKKNQKFLNLLSMNIRLKRAGIQFFNEINKYLNELLYLINQELKRKTNLGWL